MSDKLITAANIHLLLNDTADAKERRLAEIEEMYAAEMDQVMKAGYYVMKSMLRDSVEELRRIAADVAHLIPKD